MFPGTNCEYDTARAVENAGGAAEIVVVRNFSADALRESAEQLESAIRNAQMVILPGGFSGGDEPDGSGSSHPSCATQASRTASTSCSASATA